MNSTNNPPLLIVGLGNPDPKYLKTRHNIGFWFLDLLAEKYNFCLLYTSDAADDP